MPKISIVIVNWNTGPLLARCLRSIANLPKTDQQHLNQVVVVDNDSHDASVAEARSEVSGQELFHFVEPGANLGFAKGNNVAIQHLQKQGIANDHIWLLNPDTEVTPGCLTEQMAVLQAKQKVGIIGCRLQNPDGTHQDSIRPFPRLLTFFLYGLKLGRWATFPKYDYDREQVVDQVMGAAFLIRAEVIKQIGLLDETFFVWFEEVDYCRRALQADWQTFYTPQATVIHYGGISFHQLSGFKKSLPWLKSSLIYVRKHFGIVAWLTLLLITPLTILLMIPATFRHSKQRTSSHA